jgi:hypothetical protein
MLWLRLITLDNFFLSSWFIYTYTCHSLASVEQSAEMSTWLRKQSAVYKSGHIFLDRYAFYGVLQIAHYLMTKLGVVHDEFLASLAVLSSVPYVFNRITVILFRNLFDFLDGARKNIFKLVCLKFIADLANLTPYDQKKYLSHYSYIDESQLSRFIGHYLFHVIRDFMRVNVSFIIHNIMTYVYYYKYRYLIRPMNIQFAYIKVQNVIQTAEWDNLPSFVHATYTISASKRRLQSKWSRWLYKLSMLSCLWSIAELSTSFFITWLVAMVFCIQKMRVLWMAIKERGSDPHLTMVLEDDWVDMSNETNYKSETAVDLDPFIHGAALLLTPFVGAFTNSYLLPAVLYTFPILQVIIRYFAFVYLSYSISVCEIPASGTGIYSELVNMDYSHLPCTKTVEEPMLPSIWDDDEKLNEFHRYFNAAAKELEMEHNHLQ